MGNTKTLDEEDPKEFHHPNKIFNIDDKKPLNAFITEIGYCMFRDYTYNEWKKIHDGYCHIKDDSGIIILTKPELIMIHKRGLFICEKEVLHTTSSDFPMKYYHYHEVFNPNKRYNTRPFKRDYGLGYGEKEYIFMYEKDINCVFALELLSVEDLIALSKYCQCDGNIYNQCLKSWVLRYNVKDYLNDFTFELDPRLVKKTREYIKKIQFIK